MVGVVMVMTPQGHVQKPAYIPLSSQGMIQLRAYPSTPGLLPERLLPPVLLAMALPKLVAHINEAACIAIVGDYLIPYIPRKFQVDIQIPDKQRLCPGGALLQCIPYMRRCN